MGSNAHDTDKLIFSSPTPASPRCSKFFNSFILKLDLPASESEFLADIDSSDFSKRSSLLSTHFTVRKSLIVRPYNKPAVPRRMLSRSAKRALFGKGTRSASSASSNSLPNSINSTTSSMSSRSKQFIAKMKTNIEVPFGLLRLHRTKKGRTSILSRRLNKKPSTLDFRCIGMVDDYYYGNDIAPQRARAPSPVSCAPRIHWCKPDIHSDWNKDWFASVNVC